MSHRFKRPKKLARPAPPKRGGVEAKLRWYAQQIRNQQELDAILAAQPDQSLAIAWLHHVRQYLRFTPRQFEQAA